MPNVGNWFNLPYIFRIEAHFNDNWISYDNKTQLCESLNCVITPTFIFEKRSQVYFNSFWQDACMDYNT